MQKVRALQYIYNINLNCNVTLDPPFSHPESTLLTHHPGHAASIQCSHPGITINNDIQVCEH